MGSEPRIRKHIAASKPTLATLAAAYALIQIVLAPDQPHTTPDSDSYLQFASFRSATYPLFIKLVGPSSLPVLQPLLFAAALAFLSFETFASTRSLVITVGLMGAIAVNPELNKYHSMVMTESLFVSVLVALLGTLIRFARAKDLASLVAAAIFAGLAATIRPPGYALLPIPFLMVLVCRRQLTSSGFALTAAALMAITLIIGGERVFSALSHREAALSLFPHH